MLTSHRTTEAAFLARLSPWRFAVFAILLVAWVQFGKPASGSEPLPPNTVEEFKQFLGNDMDRLGKLVDLRRKTEMKIDMDADHKEQNEYYQRVVKSLDAQIMKDVEIGKERAAGLENQLNSAAVTASVLRLRLWVAPDIRMGLDTLDKGDFNRRVSAKLSTTIGALVAKGAPEDQAALCVMLGEDAAYARTLKGEGKSYLTNLQAQIPAVVKLSQEASPADRIVREQAATALAQLQAPPKDQIAAIKLLLAKDGSDVQARREAYKALVLPFESASPRLISSSLSATQYSATDQILYVRETRPLREEHGLLALPLLVAGLKDSDPDVRLMSVNALRDIATIILVPLQQAPRLSRVVVDFDNRLKDMMQLVKQIQPVTDQLAANAPAIVEAAGDSDPTIRLQALGMLNDLTEVRNRVRGWQAQLDRAGPPPPPDKPIGAAAPDKVPAQPAVLELPAAANVQAQGMGPDKLSPALRVGLKVLAKNLSDPDARVRLAALEVLENLGPDANSPDTIPALLNALHDKDKIVYWNTVRIFNRFGPINPETVVPAMTPLILASNGDGDFAKILGPTLSAYGVNAAAAVPALTRAIQLGEPDARIAYLQTLTFVGTAALDAIPTVTGLLKETDPHLRQAAAEALGRFGKFAGSARPALKALLNDENPDVRKSVAEALLRIDTK